MTTGLVSRRDIYAGRIVKLSMDTVRLPNGKQLDLEFVAHPGAAAIVPLHDDRTVTLVRQYRYSAGGWIIEIPAGKLDNGEQPEVCARRELIEEVGLKAGTLTPLGFIYATPGFCDEKIHLFLATELTATQQALEDDELLEVKRIPLSDALRMAVNNEIADGKSVAALLRAAAKLGVTAA